MNTKKDDVYASIALLVLIGIVAVSMYIGLLGDY